MCIRSPVVRCAQAGVTLIELVLFILIVSVGIVGILAVLNLTSQKSADPLIRKQALAAAEALLEEVELMPFTFCDPNDINAGTATSAAGCASTPEVIGPEPGESRYDPGNPFDNVGDYHGFPMTPILDLSGTPIAGLEDFQASVSVTAGGLGLPAADALLIAVTVAGRGETVTLYGYRTRHAPTALQ